MHNALHRLKKLADYPQGRSDLIPLGEMYPKVETMRLTRTQTAYRFTHSGSPDAKTKFIVVEHSELIRIVKARLAQSW